jgi:hypothetical protein
MRTKLSLIKIVAITLLAISIAMMDFSDLRWSVNKNAYIGLIAFVLLIFTETFYLGERRQK